MLDYSPTPRSSMPPGIWLTTLMLLRPALTQSPIIFSMGLTKVATPARASTLHVISKIIQMSGRPALILWSIIFFAAQLKADSHLLLEGRILPSLQPNHTMSSRTYPHQWTPPHCPREWLSAYRALATSSWRKLPT